MLCLFFFVFETAILVLQLSARSTIGPVPILFGPIRSMTATGPVRSSVCIQNLDRSSVQGGPIWSGPEPMNNPTQKSLKIQTCLKILFLFLFFGADGWEKSPKNRRWGEKQKRRRGLWAVVLAKGSSRTGERKPKRCRSPWRSKFQSFDSWARGHSFFLFIHHPPFTKSQRFQILLHLNPKNPGSIHP